ncbi:MAG: hypothetical protein GF346_12140 [Candidatus Eisenbacteria bacterium]|nr:hypothetical protein [Candidatus Latescibacterota bacterium]MBD3303187.1 hypothetical protein [Candidatus Eisenbacteria bacterium]
MHALELHWDLGPRFDEESLRRRIEERRRIHERLDGLIAGTFLIDAAGRRYGAFTLWREEADAERFLASPLHREDRDALGDPSLRRFDVPAFVGPASEHVAVPPDRPTLNHAMIYVRDVGRSLEFYEKRLGCRRIETMDGYARLESPGGRTTIGLHLAEKGRKLPSEGIRLYFEVDELDRFCSALREAGVAFFKDPTDMPWGWRHAYLRDPDGHEISLYRAGEKRFRTTEMKPV